TLRNQGFELDPRRALVMEFRRGQTARRKELATLLQSAGLYVEQYRSRGSGGGIRAFGAGDERLAVGAGMAKLWEDLDPAARDALRTVLSPQFVERLGVDPSLIKPLAGMPKAGPGRAGIRAYDVAGRELHRL